MPKSRTYIARHVVEIRFKEKNFKLFDFYGELIDSLHASTGFEKVKVEGAGARIELASTDYEQTYFFTLENFGFQLDGQKDFDGLKEYVKKLISIVRNIDKFTLKDILRIGTKSTIFCHIPSRSEEGIRQIFFDKNFANKSEFEAATGLKITDLAYEYFDAARDGIKSHITTGPSNTKEVIDRYFQKPKLYEVYGAKPGVFYENDTYSEELGKLTFDQLENQIKSQIEIVEKGFNGYMDLFNEKTK